MAERTLLALSPIAAPPPCVVVAGWEVSARRSTAPLRIRDCTPLAKVLVRADLAGDVARSLGVALGQATRDEHGALVIASGPGEWTLLASPGTAQAVASRVEAIPDSGLVSVLNVTHASAVIRLIGTDTIRLLAKVCAIDFADTATPNGAAFRTSVAKLVTDVVRDDVPLSAVTPNASSATEDSGSLPLAVRSYLLYCERSSGQYLFDALVDAGVEFDIDVDGFTTPGI